jgi:cobalt-zinc-cadmium efflux system outer membrane protein
MLSENSIDSTVSRLVVSVLYEQSHEATALQSVKVTALLLELLERRVELGESPPLEAVRARTEWFARRRDLAYTEAALDTATVALNLFCGGRLPDNYTIAETLEGPGAIALPANLAERLWDGNLHLLRARVTMEKTEVRTSVARKERFPRVGVFAGYETELDRTASNVGVAITIPLWNRNRGEITVTTAEHARATADLRALQVELETALEGATAAYRRARAVIHLYEEGWSEAAMQSLEIATFSFRNGESSLLEVLDAQRALLNVNVAEARSWAALATARAEIERLIAGSLESENSYETP